MIAFGVIAAREAAVAWDLRAAWGSGRVVSVRFDGSAVIPRIKGRVVRVSPTSAFAEIDDGGLDGALSFPLSAVLSVRKLHFTEPLDTPVQLPLEAILPDYGTQLSLI